MKVIMVWNFFKKRGKDDEGKEERMMKVKGENK